MTVTDLKAGKRGRIYLFVDGEFALSVDPELLYEYKIQKGSELDDAALSSLQCRQNTRYARSRALDILACGDCSEKKLYEKLITRAVAPADAAAAVAYCVEKGFVDDRRLIPRWIDYYYHTKGYGVMRVRQALLQKGFERELIDEFVQQQTVDSVAMIEDYLKKEPIDKRHDRKCIQKLMRKGFLYSDIRTALSRIGEWEEYDG